ncbi:MAG TPA: cupredoxin domain-containing protein [Vicinamibacterales bacterium]|jgi:plastocyanin|nr:cupredoxin domain-containing protein [Vicinamibacterales bacterium]
MKCRHRHPVKALLAIGATAMLIAGCGGGDSGSATANPSHSSSSSAPGDSSTGVTISDFKFTPNPLTVQPGASVNVTNDDSTPHTATADDGHSFDTGTLGQGSSKTISVTKPGTYPYHCSIHAFMHGKLIVK